MYKILVLLFIIPLASLPLSAQNLTPRVEKIVTKTLSKLWKNQEVTRNQIPTDKNIEHKIFFDGNYVYQLNINDQAEGWLVLRRALGCKVGGCGSGNYNDSAVCTADGNAYEVFDYAIVFTPDLKVKKVVVVDYPGDYGYEISSPGWLNQFIGYTGGGMNYGSDIDSISGATISANSITWDVIQVHEMMEKLVEENGLVFSKKQRS